MISSLASIHPNAQLGNNVIVEPFAVIHDKVVIGDGSHIMSHAIVMSYTTIGKNCKIFPGAV
jgi:UDP-N-acetylglucosamine acyltransferase